MNYKARPVENCNLGHSFPIDIVEFEKFDHEVIVLQSFFDQGHNLLATLFHSCWTLDCNKTISGYVLNHTENSSSKFSNFYQEHA